MKINGGYVIQPRSIDESEVSKYPPHVREIWQYLIRKANHSDTIISGTEIKRGQLFTSYRDIREDLSWFVGYRKEEYKKHHCETAMRVLTKADMIQTAKTTRGMIVTICNYDRYQDPKNYETDSEKATTPTRHRQSTDTIYKNEKNDKNKEYSFDVFWNLYDKKVGRRDKVQSKWNNLSLSHKKEILEYIPRYKQAVPDKQFRKNPQTFLNNEGWLDELIKSPKERTPAKHAIANHNNEVTYEPF